MDENTVNDVQEEVVDLPETEPVESVSDAVEAEREVAHPEQEPERPAQTPEENSAFASMRRENERLQREREERDALLASFFPNADDPMAAAMMQAYGMTPEQLEAQRSAQAEREKKDAELEALREFQAKSIYEKDLNAIKAAFPEVKAKSIDDLGPEFHKIMASSDLDPVTAYEIIRAKESREKKTPPPEIGKVNSASKAEKEYYTVDDVRSMSPEDVHKNWEKIQKSRAKW